MCLVTSKIAENLKEKIVSLRSSAPAVAAAAAAAATTAASHRFRSAFLP